LGTPIGATLGFPITAHVLASHDWHTTFFVMAALTVLVLFLVYFGLKDVQMVKADGTKKISKALKESDLKVAASIQGDKVRVSDKKKDNLQAAMAFLKEKSFGVPLQFNNFKD